MADTTTNILCLNHEEVMDFFMKSELTTNLPYDSVVDEDTLKKVTPVITFRGTRAYNESFEIDLY